MEILEDIHCLPPIDDHSIHVWGLHVPANEHRIGALEEILSDRERQKALRYLRKTDRQSSIAARGALRILLSGYTGVQANQVELAYSANGKPRMSGADIAFNVSHSGEWIVLAFGHGREIGVDIEQVQREMDIMAIAARYFTPEEKGIIEEAEDPHTVFFRLWARKEAYIKACGSTLFAELRGTAVPMGDGAQKEGWFFHHLEAGSEYAAAVVTDRPLTRLPCYDFGGLKCLDG